jgi:alkaline phosphatase
MKRKVISTTRTSVVVTLAVVAASFVALTACSSQKQASSPSEDETTTRQAPAEQEVEVEALEKPTRIILMIGDGMGVPAITAASYAKGAPLSMLAMGDMGWMTTHSYEFVTTDSAASATAIATGHKTHYEGVSVKPGTSKANETDDEQHLETVLEKAEKAGWRTGLVSTSKIVHATPAAFASHRAHRRSYEGIARDMYESGVDVLLGGGPRYFNKRSDGDDLLKGFEKKGYKIATTRKQIEQASELSDKLVGLPHDPDFPPAGDSSRAMDLADMTDSALSVLDRDNEEGFFLMVEGSQIDWRGHKLDGEGVVKETLDFDSAVAVAREYASKRDDTLVVVTADHETGGMAVLDSPYTERFSKALGGDEKLGEMSDFPRVETNKSEAGKAEANNSQTSSAPPAARIKLGQDGATKSFGPRYAKDDELRTVFGHLSLASRSQCKVPREFTGLHTSSFVPVFADGKAAKYIAQSRDNAELGRRLKTLIGSEVVGSPSDHSRQSGHEGDAKPQNIIVMIGDGMGVGAMTAAHYADGSLAMRSLPVQGMASTHSANRLVADSAAGATAIATGRRTNNQAVGMARTSDGLKPTANLFEKAEAQGKSTGIVTTTTLTHATPAAFYAHHPRRGDESKIADFFVNMPDRVAGSDGIDVAFGAGAQTFGSKRLSALKKRGVDIQSKWSDELPEGKQVMRFLGGKGMAPASERMGDDDVRTPTLRQLTRAAIGSLSTSKDGFVLVVEGGQIDWAQHGLARDRRLVDEVVDFDKAVAEAHEFARRDGNTLVVVTADHDHTTSVIDDHYYFDTCSCAAAVECGGDFELEKLPAAVDNIGSNEGLRDTSLQGIYSPLEISIQYAWIVQEGARRAGGSGPHSANFVPVFSFGPQSHKLGGFRELAEVGQVLLDALEP